jgi:outer membrane lipoprotein-sorting protein
MMEGMADHGDRARIAMTGFIKRDIMASKRVWTAAIAAGLMALGTMVYAENGAAPSTAPAPTAQEASPGAAAPLKISPDVQKLLDQVNAAYHKIDTLSLAGTVDVAFDVGGKKEAHHATFESSYKAPSQFRHEIKDETQAGLQMGSTGEKMYAYQPSMKQYIQDDAPKGQVSAADLPQFVPSLLSQQNPSLLMALVKDPTVELLQGATSVKKGADQTLDGQSYAVLDMIIPAGQEQVLIDSHTGLLKQVRVDL